MDTILARHWHHLSVADVGTLLESDVGQGLDAFEVSRRQTRIGPNRLTQKKGKSPIVLFLLQFHQPLIYILLAASAVTFFLAEYVDSGVIFGVVLINAVVGFIQESRALKAIEALARSMKGVATVVRAGQKQDIPAAELVPGDLILLESGDRVPADIRLTRSRELQIDESALTGESLPVQKSVDPLPPETLLADRRNIGYSSTLVTYGAGAGIVVGTGDATEIGRINALIASTTSLATPLTKKITEFSGVLLWLILGFAALTVMAGWLHGDPLLDTFLAAVALAVGAIPEGLPAAMTIMLAIGVSRMAHRHAIIRRMPAVEALGSTTVICSDKTGTLTQNQMTVQAVHCGGDEFVVTGSGYDPAGEIGFGAATVTAATYPALAECLRAGVLCNDSRLVNDAGKWLIEGDPTEGALIAAAAKGGLTAEAEEQSLPRIDSQPFESVHQYMATLHDRGNGARVIYVKGSIESILSRCTDALGADGSSMVLDRDRIIRDAEQLAAGGLRVLAFATRAPASGSQSVSHAEVSGNLTFLGLQGMLDPPRPQALAAVRVCQKAGIRVKMITGDHIATATAIARQIGLEALPESKQYALSGGELALLNDAEIIPVAEDTTVFARVTPEQKLRLVVALQAAGHVVAMTGDGVNDAPALKQADIGVAMGVGGTEVAREAADMVLTDDNFATIAAAVEEGRAVFDNLIKFITWTLPTNAGEGLVIMVAIFAGLTLPITPVQILWINMTTAILLGLMLAFEEQEVGLMERPPRLPKTPVLTGVLAFRVALVSVIMVISAFLLFDWTLARGLSVETARTVAVNMFVFGELFYLFNCRSLRYSMFTLGVFSNRKLILGVLAMIGVQLLFTYMPTMNLLFGSAPMGILEWVWVLTGSLTIYLTIGLEKWLRRRATIGDS